MKLVNKIKKALNSPKDAMIYILDMKIFNILSDKAFLKLKYRVAYGKKLDLNNPQNYNEKLQWLKLYNRNPKYTNLVDKYEVKKYIENTIGKEYIIPTLGVFERFEDINFDTLPDKFVMKCTHDSGGIIICKDKKKLDLNSARKIINKSLKNNFYFHGREWPYKDVKPRIIIEKFMEVADSNTKIETKHKKNIDAETLQKEQGLLDYKFMCFNGEVKLMFLDIGVIGTGTGHAKEYYRNVYDEKFELLPVLETRSNYPTKINKPKNFSKMVEIAQNLSKGIPHVRVDLYNIDGKIYFGELTFFHGSGLSNYFIPEEWNTKIGNYIDLDKVKK